MSLPLKYHFMNVLRRWKTALGAWLNIALVVAVYVMMQALAGGLEQVTQETGDPRNMMVIRQGAMAESSSNISQEQYRVVRYDDGVEKTADGQPILSVEVVSVVNLPRRDGKGEANVQFRGVSAMGVSLRPQVVLTQGRWPEAGKLEIATSSRLARRFADMGMGETLRMGAYDLKVVGIFEAGSSAFASEAWMDVDDARRLFDEPSYSSILFRAKDPSAGERLAKRMDEDKRIRARVLPEMQYYREQTKTVGPIRFLGYFLAIIMSIGAVFSAMNTMYANISRRQRELGTMRAMGYGRGVLFTGLILEGGIMGILGGMGGALLALPLQGTQTGTMAFETFTEVIFQFNITPSLMAQGVCFGFFIGAMGSILPAMRMVRSSMIAALKGA